METIDINYWLVLIVSVVQFVFGWIWHSPQLFGNIAMAGMKPEHSSEADMKKSMMSASALQLLASLLTNFVLYYFVLLLVGVRSALDVAFWIWLGFMVTFHVGAIIWEPIKADLKWKKFFVGAGYSFIAFMFAGWVFGVWG